MVLIHYLDQVVEMWWTCSRQAAN